MNEPVPAPEGPGPAGLLLSRDLIFTSKVTGTARMLGHQVLTAGNSALAQAMIAQWKPRAVFVDLAAGDLVKPEALLAYRTAASGPRDGLHVALRLARRHRLPRRRLRRGLRPGLAPRSKFSAELPDLIRRFLGCRMNPADSSGAHRTGSLADRG